LGPKSVIAGEAEMRGTILIVDDSAMMRKIVLRALTLAGLDFQKVLEAGDGKEALELLKAHTVELIMCDINMPVMSGLELLRAMREQNLAAGVPVVMVTTESSAEHVREAVAVGASGYIRKPFTPDHVKQKVLALLR
jgi:two-component system chemotaxis response regulator CheY